jgi:glycosyltransferase involved in cell wall biosynthesis
VARACGIPALGTIHGQVDFHEREKYRALKLGIIRGGIRRLVFVSEPLRRASMKSMWFRDDLTSVIPNGVDSTVFAPTQDAALRAEFGAAADDFLVGCIGRLHPVKGLEIFLEAAAILKSTFGGYRFVIVGDGDDAYTRELIALRDKLGLTDELRFAGFRSDIHRAMATLDVYALTSRTEGFSLSTIEAMASGVPVVATRCGGPEQILEDGLTGRLVENGSAVSIANCIAGLRLDPTERRRLAVNARAVVIERYTVDDQVRAYERLYEHLLQSAGNHKAQARASYVP